MTQDMIPSEMIVRRVRVDRTLTPQEAIDATGRLQLTNRNVVAGMPRGEGEEVKVFFFTLGRYADREEREREFEIRDLKPVDPYSLAAVNAADPAFADDHPTCTNWQDGNGRWCFVAFERLSGVRYVNVYLGDYNWGDYWWFAGLRK